MARLAWFNVLVHLFGLASAGVGMRPGTPLVPLSERLDYLAAYPLAWSLGWGVWMLCAAALVSFVAVAVKLLGERDALGRLSLILVVVGAGFDLFCDAVYILVFPRIASLNPVPEAIFLLLEQVTAIGSLVIANGMYSIAVLLLTLALRGRPGLAPFITTTGYGVTVFGLLLAAAAFTGVPWHIEWATGPTIGLFCVWVLLVARSLDPDRVPP